MGKNSSNRKTRRFCPSLYIRQTPPFETAPGISTYQHRLFQLLRRFYHLPFHSTSQCSRTVAYELESDRFILFQRRSNRSRDPYLPASSCQLLSVLTSVVSITCQPVQPRSVPRRLAPWHENWNLSVLFFSNFDIALGIPTYLRRLVSSCVVSITYLPIQHRNIRSRVAPSDKNC